MPLWRHGCPAPKAQATGKPRRDFSGKLGFHWPADCAQGDKALLPVGYGASYATKAAALPALAQTCSAMQAESGGVFPFFNRRLASGTQVTVRVGEDEVPLRGFVGKGPYGRLTVTGIDNLAQEDARLLVWKEPAALRLSWPADRMAGFAGPASGSVVITYALDGAPQGSVTLRGTCADCAKTVDLAPTLAAATGKGWQTAQIPLACLGGGKIGGLELAVGGALQLRLAKVELRPGGQPKSCTGPM